MEHKEHSQAVLLLLIKNARHDLPWFYLGVLLDSDNDKTSSVSYQIFPKRYEGTHIHFGCTNRRFDRFIPNDDGQTLKECLQKIVHSKVKYYKTLVDKDPSALGVHWYDYRFYELKSDGSYESEESSFQFYSTSLLEVESLMEVDHMEIEVPEAPQPHTPRQPKRV
jgi:hypothetical protein